MAGDPDLEALLDQLPINEAARASLLSRLAGPGRHYHGTGHVALLWRRHLQFSPGLAVAQPPWHGMIACAVAFHDAVFVPGRADNEAASAALFRASKPDLPPQAVAWVEGTILATADHLGAAAQGLPAEAWTARAWMLDLDLTPLGEAPEVFALNTRQLRQEFAGLPDAAWRAGTAGFLLRMTAAPQIYRSERLRAAFEAQARANLQAGLLRLQQPDDPFSCEQ